ncbi:MAG: serine hydrolase [Gammaproteobacteria bacterium]|nr:serine hydrolase [Gammaproteobacteria bacterium]
MTLPTQQWSRATLAPRDSQLFESSARAVFDLSPDEGFTYALLVVKDGQLVHEHYDYGANAFYLQYSWSMAKSITHALVGVLVGDGKLDIDAPAPVPEWQAANDPRRAITLEHLLRMSSGLEFREDYVDGQVSDVIPMLSFEGRHDMGAFAAAKPLLHAPGTFWSYASGTTNIICRILRDVVGGGETGMLAFMRERLFEPIGMTTALPKFDSAGTFVGSSYLLATPQDFARFGLLYLNGGRWGERQILPHGWVDHARRVTYADAEQAYGAHWWLVPGKPWYYASGYDGQRILIVPEKALIVVRCGRTPVAHMPRVTEHLMNIVAAV